MSEQAIHRAALKARYMCQQMKLDKSDSLDPNGHSGLTLLLSSEFKQGVNKTALRLSKLHYSLYLVTDVLQESFFVPRRSPPDSVRNLGNDVIAEFRIR